MRTRVLTEPKRTTLEGPSVESSRPTLAQPGQLIRSQPAGVAAAVGFLLADVNLRPLYANGAAVQILDYARASTA